jgi:hypothetical protein
VGFVECGECWQLHVALAFTNLTAFDHEEKSRYSGEHLEWITVGFGVLLSAESVGKLQQFHPLEELSLESV